MSNSFITDSTPASDWEKITVSSTAIGPTAAKLKINQEGGKFKRAVKVFITVETNTIRARWDGGDPTSANGHSLAANDTLTVIGEANVANLKLIRVTADATVQVTFYYNS